MVNRNGRESGQACDAYAFDCATAEGGGQAIRFLARLERDHLDPAPDRPQQYCCQTLCLLTGELAAGGEPLDAIAFVFEARPKELEQLALVLGRIAQQQQERWRERMTLQIGN